MPNAIPTHKPRLPRIKAHSADRDVARKRLRVLKLNGKSWRDLRAQVLREEPLCIVCREVGFLEAATEVDHINGDGNDNRRSNLQPLCKSHHSQKTRREMNQKNREQPGTLNRTRSHARTAAG